MTRTTTSAASTADHPHEPLRGDESKNDATIISSDDDDGQGGAGGIYNVVTTGQHDDIETNNDSGDDDNDDDFACPCCWIEAFETASTVEAWFAIMFTWAFVGFLGFWIIAFIFVGYEWAQVLYLAVAPLLLVRALQPPARRCGLLYHGTHTNLAFGVAFVIGALALLVMVLLIGGPVGIGSVLFAYLVVLPIALPPCLHRFRRGDIGGEPRSSSCYSSVGGGTTGGGAVAVADAPLYSTAARDEEERGCDGG